jgi:polyphosphate glucokinase
MEALGIDFGGSGIKGAVVNTEQGELVSKRHRIPTPAPSTPDSVTDVVAEMVRDLAWRGPIGFTVPAVVKKNVAYSAANIADEWIGTDAARLIQSKTGNPALILNDADAAGIAEMRFGAGKGRGGTVMVLTVGTGIGSVIFVDGCMVPNTELGHLEIRGKGGEIRASNRARVVKDLSWKQWSKRLNEYLQYVEFLFSPDLFIIGGGVSKKHKKFFKYLDVKAEIVPARLRNEAGIIGAAMAARERV